MSKLVIDCASKDITDVALSDEEATQIADDQAAAAVETEAERTTADRRARVVAKIDQRITQAETAYENWAGLTQAQKNAALREVVLAVAKLGRLALNRFDIEEV